MQAAIRLDHLAHLAGLQRKRSLLEGLLHVSLAKVPQITALAGAAAVALAHGQLAEGDLAALDAGLVALDDGAGLVLGAGDFALAPRGGAAAVAVLDEQVGGADLVGGLLSAALGGARRVVQGHVAL